MTRRHIPIADHLEDLSDRKQWVIAHQMNVPKGDHQFSWVPTIDPDEYHAIVGNAGKRGMRDQGLYGTAQRKMPEGTVIRTRRAYFELVCWRIADRKAA